MTNPTSVLLNKLSTQAPIVRAAHNRYEQALTAYRNRQETNQALHEELDSARTNLSQAKEIWRHLCDELFKVAQQDQLSDTSNPVLDKMFEQAMYIKVALATFQPIREEYRSKELALHAANDIDGLREIRGRLDPAQAEANNAVQYWGKLCEELLLNLAQSTTPAEAAAPPAF